MARGVTTDLIWRFLSDTKSLERGSRKAGRAMGDVESSSGRMQRGLGVATRALGTLGIALGTQQLISFATESVALARTADQVAGSFDKVFGPAAADLRVELDAVGRAMGLSQAEMESALLTTGALATGMGLTAEESAEMSKGLFTLAGDLATFNPGAGDATQALGALQAAIRGEFDPLERFGAKLTAAAIKERALADSGKTSADQLTQTDLAMATYALTLEATEVQQGALSEAMASGATDAKELEADMKDLKTQIGRQLTPAYNNLAQAMVDVSSRSDDLTEASSGVFQQIENVTGILPTLTGDMSVVDKTVTGAGQAVGTLNDSLGQALGFLPPVSNFFHSVADAARDGTNRTNQYASAWNAIPNRMQKVIDKADPTRSAINRTASAASSAAGAFSRYAFQLSRTVTQSQRVRQFGPGQGHLIAQSGKTIPGRPGSPQMVLAHAGETIQTAAQSRQHDTGNGGGGGGGGPSIVINVTGAMMDPQGAAKAVAEAMRRYERTSGRV